jgi:hypothetical protein
MQSTKKQLLLTFILPFLFITEAFSVPVDWHGHVEFNTTIINKFRRSNSTNSSVNAATNYVIDHALGDEANASFQDYSMKLSPSLIINDAISLYAELTTGYTNGGNLGNGSTLTDSTDTFGNALYYHSNSSENINITQYYLELYSDTATYKIGQHSYHWGLGALYNSPKNGQGGRHQSIRNGFTATFKLGNFIFEPFWSKINQGSNLTTKTDVTEYGLSASYINIQQDFNAGILYLVKDQENQATFLKSANTNATLGISDIKVIDIYLTKKFKSLTFSAEIPILTGSLGDVFTAGTDVSYDAKAILANLDYEISPKWSMGLNFGTVTGHDGSTDTFKALYLNPNYQVANLLFKYNLMAVGNSNYNIYDSYIVNSQFIKAYGQYDSDQFSWNFAVIYAKANQTAKVGSSFDHLRNTQYTSASEQDSNYGIEIDLNGEYHWGPNSKISADFGYLITGDFYKYASTSGLDQGIKNSWVAGSKFLVSF